MHSRVWRYPEFFPVPGPVLFFGTGTFFGTNFFRYRYFFPVPGPVLFPGPNFFWPSHSAQLLCSIEKAVWKLAQSGPSTEANMYHYRFVYTSTFFLNGRISETKRDILDPLAPKWPQRIGLRFTLSWKWPHPIFTPFFGVFLERNPFFGVFQVGQIGPLRSKTCPCDPFPTCKKKRIREAQLIVSRKVLWPLSEPKFRFLADISETVPLRQKLKKACCSFF